MAKYTVLADVSKTLVELLKDQLVPEPVAKPENIGICEPKERGSFVVGIHPYDFQINNEIRQIDPIVLPDGNLQNPPTSYQISYMISVASKAEVLNRASDEQRILGRIVQALGDNVRLPQKYMPDSLRMANEEITIQMIPMELEEKVKIWTMYSEPYKLSVFYSVGPLLVDSTIIRVPAKRVTTVGLDRRQKR